MVITFNWRNDMKLAAGMVDECECDTPEHHRSDVHHVYGNGLMYTKLGGSGKAKEILGEDINYMMHRCQCLGIYKRTITSSKMLRLLTLLDGYPEAQIAASAVFTVEEY